MGKLAKPSSTGLFQRADQRRIKGSKSGQINAQLQYHNYQKQRAFSCVVSHFSLISTSFRTSFYDEPPAQLPQMIIAFKLLFSKFGVADHYTAVQNNR
jgi:hypothetical protein